MKYYRAFLVSNGGCIVFGMVGFGFENQWFVEGLYRERCQEVGFAGKN